MGEATGEANADKVPILMDKPALDVGNWEDNTAVPAVVENGLSAPETNVTVELPPNPPVILYHRRFYIVLLFSLCGFMQACVWNTWGPLSHSANIALGWEDYTIALQSNVGMLAYILSGIFFWWLMDVKGLRWATLLTIFVVAVGTGLRCITTSTPTVTWLTYLGQFLNGLGGPVAMGGPPVLSAVWFPTHQRTTATGFSAGVTGLGVAVSFMIGPLVVPQPPPCETNLTNSTTKSPEFPEDANCSSSQNKADITAGIMRLMYIEFGFSALLFLLVLVYFPSKPPTPPSYSAGLKRVEFKSGLKKLFRHKKFWMIGIPYAVSGGVYAGWISIFAIILRPVGITEGQAGTLGFWATVAGQAAVITVAFLADVFSRRLRLFLMALYSLASISFLAFALTRSSFVPYNTAVLYVGMLAGTVCVFGTGPLFFEVVCESTYPIAEGITNGLLTWLNNVAGFIFLFLVMIPMGHIWMNWCLFGSFLLCIPVFWGYKERYGRTDTDLGQSGSDQIQEESTEDDTPVLSDTAPLIQAD